MGVDVFRGIMPEMTISPHDLRKASAVIAKGGVIAFPTETFYGLGVNPFDRQALERVFALKGRSPAGPLLVLIEARSDVRRLASEVTPTAERLMEAYWPGPLTLIFRALPSLPPELTAGTGTIGVRLSSHPDLPRLLEAAGGALTGTSANRTGEAPASTADEVRRIFGSEVDLVLDGGRTAGAPPSTVLDTTTTPPRLVREGRVSKASLLAIIGSLAA